ncbi:hypothetical protein ACSFA0_01095 [Variovorax sp. LT1P1]|uniref:hypothetical protein n=1 Tax=Variovorax sp. LT1P1 TaxID=3443730 RepID=UPI003F44F919
MTSLIALSPGVRIYRALPIACAIRLIRLKFPRADLLRFHIARWLRRRKKLIGRNALPNVHPGRVGAALIAGNRHDATAPFVPELKAQLSAPVSRQLNATLDNELRHVGLATLNRRTSAAWPTVP